MTIPDKLSVAAIIISIGTFFFSWYSFYKTDKLSRTTFNKNYRPYITAGNFAYIDQKDGKYYPQMNVLIFKVFNAPSFVTSRKLSFYARENNTDSLIFEHPNYESELFYPFDNSQYTIGTDEKIISHQVAQKLYPKTLIRKARVEYQWISDSTLKYFFEGEWKYNLEKHDWDIISQSAD